MTQATTNGSSEQQDGVVVSRRSTLDTLRAVVGDPLQSLPDAVYTQRLVIGSVFGRPRSFVCDPALIHELLVGQADRLEKSDATKRVLGPALGDGLITADGAHWRWQRQAIAPTFQHARLAALIPAMIAAAEAMRDRWLALPPGTAVDLSHEMMMTTYAIIIETMLSGPSGVDTELVSRSTTDYLAATPWMFVLSLLYAPNWVPYPGRTRAKRAAAAMRAAVTAMVVKRRQADLAREDLVALLLAAKDPETGRRASDVEIADNILTFITAGHETTALALGWATALLSQHPDYEARVLDEIARVTGGGPVLPEHVPRFDLVRRVINETMRLYPPAPIIARQARREVELAGTRLPAGSTLVIPIYALHRHRSFWNDPERFDPDRFAPDQASTRPRYAFMPFGAGSRICIGSAFAMNEAVAVLAVMLQALRIEPPSGPLPKPSVQVTLRPAKPLKLRVAPRR